MKVKNKLIAMGVLCALSVPQLAGAEGFAINEWSAEGVAMGGRMAIMIYIIMQLMK